MSGIECELGTPDLPVADWESIGRRDACDEPAIGTAMFACVHEHIDRPRVCAGCAIDLQHAAPGMICPYCADGSSPHECPVRVVIEWDDSPAEPVTVVQEAA